MRLTIAFRNDGLGEGSSQRFFAGPPKDCCRLCIPIGHNPGRVDGDHSVKRGIDDGPIPFLTLEQRRFSGFRPGTFLLCLPMFGAQACRGPEQQPEHGKPDRSAYNSDFPQKGMNRGQDFLSLHSDQNRPSQPGKFSKPFGLGIPSHHLDMPLKMLFLDKPRYAGFTQQGRRKSKFFEIHGSLVQQI